ncbi:MAG: transaldolase [Pseudomonadota bacterium]
MTFKMKEIAEFGQSLWLDTISRSLLDSGELKTLIAQGLMGMTSNPTIFDNAVSKSNDYDEEIKRLSGLGKSTFEIYDELTVKDIQDAADLLMPVYESTNKRDGYISLEINPTLAQKTKETIEEGRRLWAKGNRLNLMLKVPATDEGFDAIETLISEGMNVNATLIFSVAQYEKTAKSYINGVKKLIASGKDAKSVHSVASVFVSRIDGVIDNMLEKKLGEVEETKKDQIASYMGKAAIANTKLVHEKYIEVFSQDEFKDLEAKGANWQRALWASTGTKNPSYSDILYVQEVIAPNTVNTVPDKTLAAFIDHGKVCNTIESDYTEYKIYFETLNNYGININTVCNDLLDKGLVSFVASFNSLLKSIEEKSRAI